MRSQERLSSREVPPDAAWVTITHDRTPEPIDPRPGQRERSTACRGVSGDRGDRDLEAVELLSAMQAALVSLRLRDGIDEPGVRSPQGRAGQVRSDLVDEGRDSDARREGAGRAAAVDACADLYSGDDVVPIRAACAQRAGIGAHDVVEQDRAVAAERTCGMAVEVMPCPLDDEPTTPVGPATVPRCW